jgi:hypothetical protein
MSPDPVIWTALDRSTHATATPGGDPFYVEPPSVQPGLTIGEYRRRRELSRKATRRRHPIAVMLNARSLDSPVGSNELRDRQSRR